MLFMTVYTYSSGQRDEVVKRRAEKGPMAQGVKIVGEWSALTSGRVFRLLEADDPAALFGAAYAWTDLGKLDVYPVMTVDDIMKMLGG